MKMFPIRAAAVCAILLFAACFGTPIAAHADDAGAGGRPRVLLVGDSWVWYIHSRNVLSEELAKHGHSDKTVLGEKTAVNGATAGGFARPKRLEVITGELRLNPTIDVVVLSLGGNDLIQFWADGVTDAQYAEKIEFTMGKLATVTDAILAVRPNIRIVICGYDYPNLNKSECLPHYKGRLAKPRDEMINALWVKLEKAKAKLADGRDRVEYNLNLGLMQRAFGVPEKGVAPGTLPAPGDPPLNLPFPGGDANLPGPQEAINTCFHLNRPGLELLAERLWTNHLAARFAPTVSPAAP